MKKISFTAPILALILIGAGCTNTTKTSTVGGSRQDMAQNSPEDQAIIEHCKMMPGMAMCAKYNQTNQNSGTAQNTLVDRSTIDLPDAQPETTVSLNNGDTYSIAASFVKKTINGTTIRMLAYNGQIPGPLLKVTQGGTVTINFKNNLDEPTTIHWHGLRLDNKYDGVPDVTQPAVQPGESYTYQLKFPDTGFYWYHPHTREDYEQNLGMYGLISVGPTAKNALESINSESYLTLSDILMQDGDVYPFDKTRINHALMGRFGNIMLVNGDTNYALSAHQGDVVRLNLVNVANTRVFRLTIPGARIKLVGGDNGWYQTEQFVDSVTLGPSERAIIDVQFTKLGSYTLHDDTPAGDYPFGTIMVDNQKSGSNYNQTFTKLATHILDSNAAALAAEYLTKPVDKQINLTIDMPGMMGNMQMNGMMGGSDTGDGIEWEDTMAMMNQNSSDKALTWVLQDKDSGAKNKDINYVVKQGDKVKIRIFNDPKSMHAMQHVIHFHGNRFLVLDVNEKANTDLVWKDSVLIPKGATVDILLDASNPGTWMAHCHIAEHLEAGMMMEYKVE